MDASIAAETATQASTAPATVVNFDEPDQASAEGGFRRPGMMALGQPPAPQAQPGRAFAAPGDNTWANTARSLRSALAALGHTLPACLPGEPGQCGESNIDHAAASIGLLMVAVDQQMHELDPDMRGKALKIYENTRRRLNLPPTLQMAGSGCCGGGTCDSAAKPGNPT